MYDAPLTEPQDAAGRIEPAGRAAAAPARPPEPRTWDDPREDPVLTDALIQLLRSAGSQLPADGAEAGSCINRALSLLEAGRLKRGCDGGPQSAPAMGGLSPWRVRRITQHIEENLGAAIKIEDLASLAKLSVRHFSLAFKQSFGISPHAHIVRLRIEKARELMLLTDEPLAQVAVACGLADQAHLSKWFRRLIGISPNAWRRQYRA